jgi:hypothetical protein
MEKKLKVLGIVSVTIGIVAALLCVVPPYGVLLALPVGFIGMICSSVYIFLDMKHNIGTKKFTAGVMGVILNSLPILFVLIVVIMTHYQ